MSARRVAVIGAGFGGLAVAIRLQAAGVATVLLEQRDRPGGRAYVYEDLLPEFKGGKVDIAIINFLRYTHFNNKTTYFGPHPDYYAKPVPPNGHVSLWMEEAKLSPAVLEAAAEPE